MKKDTASQTNIPCCSISPSPPYCQPQTGKETSSWLCKRLWMQWPNWKGEVWKCIWNLILLVAADVSQSTSILPAMKMNWQNFCPVILHYLTSPLTPHTKTEQRADHQRALARQTAAFTGSGAASKNSPLRFPPEERLQVLTWTCCR